MIALRKITQQKRKEKRATQKNTRTQRRSYPQIHIFKNRVIKSENSCK